MPETKSAVVMAAFASLLLATQVRAAEPIDSICTKAAGEPTLTWYSAQEPTRNEAAVAAFHKVYPNVKIQSLRLASGALASRYAAERSAGVNNAGLITVGDPIFVGSGHKAGWFVEFDKSDLPALARLDKRWFDRGGAMSTTSILGISYNKNVVGNNPPRTWADLLDPKYKGQILFGDPRAIPSYLALARIWREKYGDDFLKKLAAQKLTVIPSVVPATQQLAAGEVAIVVPNVLSVVTPLKEAGAPIDFVIPEPTTGNEFVFLISTGTASPNAAKCFYNFAFTPAGQEAYTGPVSSSSVGPFGDVPGIPANYIDPRIEELQPMKATLLGLLGLN
jgi:iron(III) transport system substrate-binding protein